MVPVYIRKMATGRDKSVAWVGFTLRLIALHNNPTGSLTHLSRDIGLHPRTLHVFIRHGFVPMQHQQKLKSIVGRAWPSNLTINAPGAA